MKKIIGLMALAFLAAAAHAQLSTMEQIPTIVQTKSTNTSTPAFGNNVSSGSTLIGLALYSGQTTAPSAPTDSLSTSFSLTSCSVQRAGISEYLYAWIGSAPSGGADTVTFATGTGFQSARIIEVKHLSTTVDVCTNADNNASASSVANIPSITTTKYRDLILDCELSNNNTAGFVAGNASNYAALLNSTTGRMLGCQYRIMGDPGTESGVTVTETVGPSASVSELVIAVESSTSVAVSTAAIPDAVQGVAYQFQMGAIGGTGTNSWTTTAGNFPCGLSMSSTGLISGTPTCSNPNPITFQVTDASSNTATANLAIAVGTSADTITHVQSGSAGSGTQIFSSSVTAGDLIMLTTYSGSNFDVPVCTDTRSTTFVVLPQIAMSTPSTGSTQRYWQTQWGFAGTSGSNDTITCTPAPTTMTADEFTHVQQIFDSTAFSIQQASGGSSTQTITSNTMSAPVGETLYGVAGMGTASGSTMAADSPFAAGTTNTNGSGRWNATYQIGVASGSQTASWDLTGNTAGTYNDLLFGFRATKSGTAPQGRVQHRGFIF